MNFNSKGGYVIVARYISNKKNKRDATGSPERAEKLHTDVFFLEFSSQVTL